MSFEETVSTTDKRLSLASIVDREVFEMKSWHFLFSIGNFFINSGSGLFVVIASLMAPGYTLASNPWARAVGEAVELHDSTTDLRNRMHRLYLAAPATSLSCSLDELACHIKEMVKCGAEYNQLQWSLQSFQTLEQQMVYAITHDYRIHSDRSVRHYVERIEEDYHDLVRDLSKCQIPLCNTGVWPTWPQPRVLPPPYPPIHYGAKPPLPVAPPVQPWLDNPSPGHRSPWDGYIPNGGANDKVPQYWQGSNGPYYHGYPGLSNFPRASAEAMPSWFVPSPSPGPKDVAELIGMIIDRSRR